MPAKIHLEINYQITAADDRIRFHKAAQWVAEQFDIQDFQVSIAIVDDPTIHQLNREHLEHDWPTDVISFIFETNAELGPRRRRSRGQLGYSQATRPRRQMAR